MKKIVLSIIIVIFGYGLYTFLQPPKSPKDQSTYSKNSKNYIIDYSRPYKKNRLIFGDKDDQALVPYNQYWRTGANFSTDLTVSDDFIFGDESVSKGSYWLYTIPNKNTWKVILNSDHGSFSFFNPDENNNVAEILIDSYELQNEIEQLTIDFIENDSSLYLRLRWDKTGLQVPIN